MRYSRISRLQGGAETQYWRGIRVLAEEGNSHDRKAVAQRLTTSPSVTLLPNLRQVQIPLSGTVPEVYIAIMQYPGVPPLPKLKVLTNFRVSQ